MWELWSIKIFGVDLFSRATDENFNQASKNANKLNEIGEELMNIYNINYLYADFKKKDGYKRSIELSKIHNLYRQDYCGCIDF